MGNEHISREREHERGVGDMGRFFDWLYRRSGARYLDVLLLALIAFVLVVAVPAYAALLIPYFDVTARRWLQVVLVFEVAMVLAGGGVFVIARRTFAPILCWLRGQRDAEAAAAAWESAVAVMPRLAAAVGGWYTLLCIPSAVYVSELEHLAWFAALLYFVALLFLIGGLVVFGYLFFEQAFRPLIRELASSLNEYFRPPSRTISLGGKMALILPAINLYTGMIVAMVSTTPLGLDARLAVTTGAALLVTSTVSLGLTLMFRNSLLARLADMRRAIARVDRGDLAVRLPSLAGDELDDVGRSFNGMVIGLQEREALRELNAGLVDELRASRARIVAAAVAERRRVERDLHDGAQQRLVLLRLKLALAQRTLATEGKAADAAIGELLLEVDSALAELRDLAHGIYPVVLENEGLRGALREAVERAALPAELASDGTGRYPPELEAAVYFCCLEALQNASKHAGDNARAKVAIGEHDGTLRFTVADDGRGFESSAAARGAGIQNMADRIGALGGTLSVESAPGSGTTIAGTIPLAQPRSHASTASTRR